MRGYPGRGGCWINTDPCWGGRRSATTRPMVPRTMLFMPNARYLSTQRPSAILLVVCLDCGEKWSVADFWSACVEECKVIVSILTNHNLPCEQLRWRGGRCTQWATPRIWSIGKCDTIRCYLDSEAITDSYKEPYWKDRADFLFPSIPITLN